MKTRLSRSLFLVVGLVAISANAPIPVQGQDWIKSMPGYDQFESMRTKIPGSLVSGSINATWAEDSGSFEYVYMGKRFKYDVKKKVAVELEGAPAQGGGRAGGPERGRQFDSAESPDGKLKAFYRDRNMYLSNTDGSGEKALTTDGNADTRIKNGSASWVYGEELGQRTAMWWSTSSQKVAYFRFDDSGVPDYQLQMDQTKIQSSLDIEAYPKAGVTNPIVDLFAYDITSGKTTKMDIRDGKPMSDDVVGHYVYNASWTPDGKELLVNRTNRWQNILEIAACSPETGKCRVVIHEEWLESWVDNTPTMQFLADGQRFVWESERTGWLNYYLYDLSGKLLATLTNHNFEVAGITSVDEKANALWYMARSGDNPMKTQLHRVGLDGKGDKRITNPAFNHSIRPAPNNKYFVDVAQTFEHPPVSSLIDASGKTLAEIATSDLTKFRELGLHNAELFTFKAADGVTDLYGMLSKPSNFDPSKQYPLLISVYAGPKTNGARETFGASSALAEYGFLVASLDSRSAAGRGKRFLDAIYQKLGVVEIDDQAAGVKALRTRPYVDGSRVGIFGTSYGGYASAMALVRYPDVFHAASSSSPVTDWRHYDTIYTERYMRTPQANTGGYDEGSVMTYANDLQGRLMLYYGTADNNVHPSNMMQFIDVLQKANKSFDVQVGPDKGHSGINQYRMMEFFIDNLVIRPSVLQNHN
ncbi:MAG: DPP IV N-terminal domain-containing protein [Bacteroidetes bacterium]|nr:DPP IV N-terminal domain-containing protein [Bacteroidota bacterium]